VCSSDLYDRDQLIFEHSGGLRVETDTMLNEEECKMLRSRYKFDMREIAAFTKVEIAT